MTGRRHDFRRRSTVEQTGVGSRPTRDTHGAMKDMGKKLENPLDASP